MINRAAHAKEPTFFDDKEKLDLYDRFQKQKSLHEESYENRASLDDKIFGVKTYNNIAKNKNSVDGYHIVSNLTTE